MATVRVGVQLTKEAWTQGQICLLMPTGVSRRVPRGLGKSMLLFYIP